MRAFGHWTPRYVFDRSRSLLSYRLHPDWPWFTPATVGFLKLWLKSSDDVFEWGCGRSTIWIARRTRSITSVETDKEWIVRVQSLAERTGLKNVGLRFCPCDESPERIEAYVSQISLGQAMYDAIVVDGSCRDRCALSALEHLKPGGLLLVDNINWYLPSGSVCPGSRRGEDGPASPFWSEFSKRVGAWRRIWTSNGVTDTAIWFSTP
jgi:predicted O-methyltransferase YrrM